MGRAGEQGGWSVQLGSGRPEVAERPGRDGHPVLSVKDRWLVDLTLDQASRPGKGIPLRPGFTEAPEFLRGRADQCERRLPRRRTRDNHENRRYTRPGDWWRVRPGSELVTAVRQRARSSVERTRSAFGYGLK